jgi:ankyrin repeat protein
MAELYLDTLVPKQKVKEFKTVAKAVKNKDDTVKIEALQKLAEDPRYVTEGGCIMPLLEIMAPKKKTLAFTETALDAFVTFLHPAAPEVAEGEEAALAPTAEALWAAPIAGLETIESLTSSLDALKVLSGLLVYKDDVKPVKPPKVKKGETPPPPPPPPVDTQLSINLRRNSLKSVFYIADALANNNNSNSGEKLRTLFAEVEDLTPNVCATISRQAAILMPPAPVVDADATAAGVGAEGEAGETVAAAAEPEPELSEEEKAEKEEAAAAALGAAEEECEWALISLALLVSASPKACKTVLESEAAKLIPALLQCKQAFTLPLLKVLYALAQHDTTDIPGLVYVTTPEVIPVLVNVATSTSEALCAAEMGETGQCESADPSVPLLHHLGVVVAMFTHIAYQQRQLPDRIAAFNVQSLQSLVPTLNNAIMSPKIWEVARTPLPGQKSLGTFVDSCCVLLGTISMINTELRRTLCCYETASTLLSLLQQARDVVGDVPTHAAAEGDSEEDTAAKEAANAQATVFKVALLRRAAEKALLTIMCDDESEGEASATVARWASCGNHKTDSALFAAPAESAAEAEGEDAPVASAPPTAIVSFPGEQLVSLLDAVGQDDDLADRAARIIAALTLGATDSTAFATQSLKIGAEEVSKLAAVVLARGLTVAQNNLAKASAAAPSETEPEAAAEAAEEKGEAEAEAEAEAESAPVLGFTPPAAGPADLASMEAGETLYLCLAVAECVLGVDADSVNAFASEETVAALVQTIFSSGPTSVLPGASEAEVCVYDTRNLSWVPAEGTDTLAATKVYLRPLVLDTLTAMLNSDSKYREYEPLEGEEAAPAFPLAAGTAVPASASAAEEAALRVCRLAADCVTATLLLELSFACNTSKSAEVYAGPAVPGSGVLVTPVLNAALRSATAVGSCGQAGLLTALQALADAGFAPAAEAGGEGEEGGVVPPSGAMRGLLGFLEGVKAPPKATSPKSQADDSEGVAEEKGEDDAAEAEADAPALTVAAALADFSWAAPEVFSEVTKEALPTSARNVLQTPALWPFLSFLGPGVAILSNPGLGAETAALAVQLVASATSSAVHDQATQPVCFDVFSACFVSMGGAVAIAGASGAFGHLDANDKALGASVGCDVAARGFNSEDYWVQINAPPVPAEGEEAPEEGDEPEPHTGPSKAMWADMLRLAADSLHLKCPASTALTAALQGACTTMGMELVARGSDVNAKDGHSLTALMYALLLRDEDAFSALMAASPDLELTDGQGNPVIKYGFLSLPPAEVVAITTGKQWNDRSCASAGPFAARIVAAGADTNSADTDGNSVLMLAVGLASVSVSIGGVQLAVSSAAYCDEEVCSEASTYEICEHLLKAGARVNTCNKNGMTALHVVAARGHVELINLLLHFNVSPCVNDKAGMLPLHYLAACCPPTFAATLSLMMKISDNRPVLKGHYDDERLSKDKDARLLYDIDCALENVFADSIVPASIAERRLSAHDLLKNLTGDSRSLFQLLLAGHVMADGFFAPFVSTSSETKRERMQAAVHMVTTFLTNEMKVSATDLAATTQELVGSTSPQTNFSSLHAACLLFQGTTDRIPLTPAQKRSKRVVSYESPELHILAIVSGCDAGASTTQVVKGGAGWPVAEGGAWTPLHASVWANNPPLARSLLAGCDLSLPEYADLAQMLLPPGAVSEQMTKCIVSSLADCAQWSTFLTPTLLRAAVDSRNGVLVAALVAEPKVDPNTQIGEGAARHTALHEAVEAASGSDVEEAARAQTVVEAFAASADRLDMCVEDAFGNTCVDAAIASRNLTVVTTLLSMRRNDVIERVLTSRNGGASLLFELEEENMQRAKDAGYYFSEPAPAPVIAAEEATEGEAAADPDIIVVDVAEPEPEAEAEAEAEEPADTDGTGTAEIEVIDSAETNVASYNPTTEADLQALHASNALVTVLVEALNGLVGEDCHCHSCYHEGKTYSQYVSEKL